VAFERVKPTDLILQYYGILTSCRPHPASCSLCTRSSFSRHEDDCLPLFSAKFKYEWRYSSIPTPTPLFLHGMHRNNFTFIVMLYNFWESSLTGRRFQKYGDSHCNVKNSILGEFCGSHGGLVYFLLVGYNAASDPGVLGQHSHFKNYTWHTGSRWYTPDFHIVTMGI
jgi:hypothetical protein